MAANSHLTTAAHALAWLELARRRGHDVLASERIAASLASDPALVRRLLTPLRTAGLLRTGRGPGAGWSLARPAADITLADVHAALGEPPLFALHPHEPDQECPVGFGIGPVLGEVYADVADDVRARLGATTVASLLDRLLEEHPRPA